MTAQLLQQSQAPLTPMLRALFSPGAEPCGRVLTAGGAKQSIDAEGQKEQQHFPEAVKRNESKAFERAVEQGPPVQRLMTSSMAATESVMAIATMAEPIMSNPPREGSEDLTKALDEVEATAKEAQGKITENRMRSQKQGISIQEMKWEESHFVWGPEEVQADVLNDAISDCETAAAKADAALNRAKRLIRKTQTDKELPEDDNKELTQLLTRAEACGKKIADFKKETNDRKLNVMAEEVRRSSVIQRDESIGMELMDAPTKRTSRSGEDDDFSAEMDHADGTILSPGAGHVVSYGYSGYGKGGVSSASVTVEAIKEAMEKVPDLEKEAIPAMTEVPDLEKEAVPAMTEVPDLEKEAVPAMTEAGGGLVMTADCRKMEEGNDELLRKIEELNAQLARQTARAEKAEAECREQKAESRKISSELDRAKQQLQGEKRQMQADQQALQMKTRESTEKERRMEERLQTLGFGARLTTGNPDFFSVLTIKSQAGLKTTKWLASKLREEYRVDLEVEKDGEKKKQKLKKNKFQERMATRAQNPMDAVQSAADDLKDRKEGKAAAFEGDKGEGKGMGWEKGEKGKGKGKGKGMRLGPGDRGRLVHVGNLPIGIPWQEVKDLFAKHGKVIFVEVPTNVVTSPVGRHSKVLFETKEAAQSAIKALNDTDFEGLRLKVVIANIICPFSEVNRTYSQ
eukprot:s376_g18.t1